MTNRDPAALEARLGDGEWLTVTEVTALLKPYKPTLSRVTVHRWLVSGRIRYRQVGEQRTCDPADVRKILDESRQVRRGASPRPRKRAAHDSTVAHPDSGQQDLADSQSTSKDSEQGD